MKELSISMARRQLCQLHREVTAKAGERVYIGRRDQPHQAVLLSADYLRELEEKSLQLERRVQPFRMQGTIRIRGEAGEVLTEVRADARAEERRRAEGLASSEAKARS
ncbi:MAG: hypothetical protein ACYC6M_00050 [Terriglobales bacterium]